MGITKVMNQPQPIPEKEEFFDLLHEAIGKADSEELRKSVQESENESDEN